jgi:CheY-like chemotaxis protein
MHASMTIITKAENHYFYPIFDKSTSFYNSHDPHYHSQSSSSRRTLQSHESNTTTTEGREPFLKRLLIVDDDPDITLTFGVGLEGYYYRDNDKIRFEVYPYNNPLVALSEFKPNFYDLLLTDIFMPHMNGFELSQKILELDINVRVCFTSSAEVNIEALREVYPKLTFGCFIKKPVKIEYLVQRLLAELD